MYIRYMSRYQVISVKCQIQIWRYDEDAGQGSDTLTVFLHPESTVLDLWI